LKIRGHRGNKKGGQDESPGAGSYLRFSPTSPCSGLSPSSRRHVPLSPVAIKSSVLLEHVFLISRHSSGVISDRSLFSLQTTPTTRATTSTNNQNNTRGSIYRLPFLVCSSVCGLRTTAERILIGSRASGLGFCLRDISTCLRFLELGDIQSVDYVLEDVRVDNVLAQSLLQFIIGDYVLYPTVTDLLNRFVCECSLCIG